MWGQQTNDCRLLLRAGFLDNGNAGLDGCNPVGERPEQVGHDRLVGRRVEVAERRLSI
jgi:hypothetical protein